MSEKTVLIVDDEPDIRDGIREALEMHGLSAVLASNGQEALDILAFTQIDLILLDFMMPVMNGNEFMEERSKRPDLQKIPVVIVTANRVKDINDIHLKAQGLLKKPIGLDDLMGVVEGTLKVGCPS